ncbi:MAG: hypothetical protein WBB67_07265 [bacterium]
MRSEKNNWITCEKLHQHIFARDIAENLESALEQFRSIYEDLEEK